jgi:hypothetical protein
MRSSSESVRWLDPADITLKIAPAQGLRGETPGDWDIERRHVFAETVKARSMAQRYREGRKWIETDLFTDAYTRRLARDGNIGRSRTLQEVADDYHRRFDVMFEEMGRTGFRLANRRGKPHALPALLVGRGGEVFIGNQGNHRLAMAQLLGLKEFAGEIVCWHPQA